MSTDPMSLMLEQLNSSAYDDLIKDAETDNRVGDHEALVQKVTNDHWKSGDPRQKIIFVLLTANNAKADWTFSPPPPPEVIAKEKDTWDSAKKRGIAGSITMLRQLVKDYGVTLSKEGYLNIREGQKFNVKTVKTKREADGSGGFVRVVSFLPKERAVGEAAASAAASDAPAF